MAHSGLHAETGGRFGWGWYHYSRSVPHVHQHPRAGYQNGKFCRFWVLVGDAPEERRKPSEQRCAYARRCSEGVAAPLGCVTFLLLSKLRFILPAHRAFRVCEARGGITTLGALCVLLKCRTAACQSGSFAVFCGRAGVVPRTIPIFLRIHRIFCWQFQLQTLLRYGTISSTNWNFQISLCKQPLNLHHQLQFPDGC